MPDEQTVALTWTADTFRPVPHAHARWLNEEDDFPLYCRMMQGLDLEPPTREEGAQWHRDGYHFCAILEESDIVARAAVWTYSEQAWELASVCTREDRRGQGHAKATCSFVTDHILRSGRTATCHTRETNLAMQRVAESLGYWRV